ncbi:MAG: RluA family pseudouridine synthase [Faecalibacillus sp.]
MKYQIKTSQTIKDFLLETPLSQAMIKRIKRNGDFLVNGKHQTVRYLLQKGDLLEIILPQEITQIKAQKIPLKIIYEDDFYMIVDKQSGIPCIPTKRYPENTLANGIIYYFQQNHIASTVHLVNRLDKETSGYMLVAKDSLSHALLSNHIKQIKRVYHCLVDGLLEGEGVICQPISKKENSMQRYIDKKGKRSLTYYRVLKQYRQQTLVECVLETGRTHQIRVHMASLGHPLSGDFLYGSKNQQEMYLDSVEIEFIHPYTKQHLNFKKT